MFSEPRLAQDLTMPSSLFLAGVPLLEAGDALPQMPILAATRLQLELLLQERSVDLKAIAEIILADAGATLQVLRLIGEEYPNDEERPTRIEDCIVSLPCERWYEVVCAAGTSHSASLLAEWQHCRRIAECARELARSMDGFQPEQAYLVGLLFRLGRFPRLLGWRPSGDLARVSLADAHLGEDHAVSLMLAEYWNLPAYLLSALREQAPADQPNQDSVAGWAGILQVAQELAERARLPALARCCDSLGATNPLN